MLTVCAPLVSTPQTLVGPKSLETAIKTKKFMIDLPEQI